MTVCIAAMCCDREGHHGQAVVVASDRMVTMGGLIEFEHDIAKIAPVARRAAVLIAGDSVQGFKLTRDIADAIPGEDPEIPALATALAQRYAENRRRLIPASLFDIRGMQMVDFYQGQQMHLHQNITFQIDQAVQDFNLGVQAIVAGVDSTGAHVFVVENPGSVELDMGVIGFTAIGSGGLHATQSLIGSSHTSKRSMNASVFNVFLAKKRAEVAPGVGRDTDLHIITRDGITVLDATALDELEGLYKECAEPISAEVRERIAALDLERKEEPQA